MSRPNLLRGTYITVLMGNGAGPEVFSVLCGITTKSITDQVNTADVYNRDCANPDEIPSRDIIATSRQWSLRGGGSMNRDDVPRLEAAMGIIKNFRFAISKKTGETGTPLNGYYSGRAMITNKTLNGDDGGFAGIDLAFESDGPWVWVDVP